ncbi:MAG: Glu-tRNA(Gln) amidotransferase subunit GatE [Candidatus Cloacimonetes bacterium]|nr:Glu-tRNA(Gln) amidotransferase subunit GatE [Candidatus Cloacimonadota bacterium]
MQNQWEKNWLETRQEVGWVDLKAATPDTYKRLGFKCGLEVHQQLLTSRKLFCRCPAGIYSDLDIYDAEIVRHMRPTLSELGEYDGTALMEFKTRKQIVYRIKNETACTYEIDDTPPFPLNREALAYGMEIALLLKMNIVGELHITRKQYLDGSIPTGFQRTTIVGIEGEIPISSRKIRIIQFSIEEDSCREVSDHRHTRTYYTDRLGMPLIETVTYPDMLTPFEAAEACQYIRFLARSSGRVRTGIGAARQDVNVSVTGGTRVEIKGVAHISWIPILTHNEAFRQYALLRIVKALKDKGVEEKKWSVGYEKLQIQKWKHIPVIKQAAKENWLLISVNLPRFRNILSFFTQQGRTFADEISDRLKVIPCLEKPNMFHSEELTPTISPDEWQEIARILKASEDDAQILFWTHEDDLKTAIETIEERCLLAFRGVPNETRKSLANGTNIFERVLPGADRMYPDTDSKPISISSDMIEEARKNLPIEVHQRFEQLAEWTVPQDAYTYILRNNLMPVISKISEDNNLPPKKVALLFAHNLRSLQGDRPLPFKPERISELINFITTKDIAFDIIYEILPILYENPKMLFSSLLTLVGYNKISRDEIIKEIPILHQMYQAFKHKSKYQPLAERDWIMGRLRKDALGNIPLTELEKLVRKEIRGGNGNA